MPEHRLLWTLSRTVCPYGFARSERNSISADEVVALREIGAGWLGAGEDAMAASIDNGALV